AWQVRDVHLEPAALADLVVNHEVPPLLHFPGDEYQQVRGGNGVQFVPVLIIGKVLEDLLVGGAVQRDGEKDPRRPLVAERFHGGSPTASYCTRGRPAGVPPRSAFGRAGACCGCTRPWVGRRCCRR